MSIQPEPTFNLTRSTENSPSAFELKYQFADDELAAFRKHAEALQVIQDFHCDASHPMYPNLEDAEFELVRTVEDFYKARLSRLMPDRADLIEWVFYQETYEQAIATVRAS